MVDLPTPPLQLDTAMMWRTLARPPGRESSATMGFIGWEVIFTLTLLTHGSSCITSRQSWLTDCFGCLHMHSHATGSAPACWPAASATQQMVSTLSTPPTSVRASYGYGSAASYGYGSAARALTPTNCSACLLNMSFTGQAGVVSSRVRDTCGRGDDAFASGYEI